MAQFTQTNNVALADFINEYLTRGFGSMNKNDFEVWIFNYLLQNRLQGMSNYDISVELRIPETKVKRLRYESSLKYGNPTDTTQYNKAFHTLLGKVNMKKGTDSIIQFAVEDIQLRKYLDSILKKKGRFSDTSFNSEVVSITLDDLAELLDATCTSEDKKKFMQKAKGGEKFGELVKKALVKLVSMTIETGITSGISMGLSQLLKCI